ncbi:MAG: FG-GAP-like repeat-containing protein, partial [Verrucomicrobiales bacterium]
LLHFGIGDASVDELTVSWPGGRQQRFTGLEAGRRYQIVEGSHVVEEVAPVVPIFAEQVDAFGGHRHQEQAFDDFASQPLLPNQLSKLGPGMAVGGRGIVWLGGGKGQAGEIRRGPDVIYTLEEDAACEDMGGLFFDADGDGDEDLYVVSGGVECGPGDPLLQDRLYLNNGSDDFGESAVLPDLRDSGGVVVAADFDRDGDLDLFVGGRVIPGRFPESPHSRLLVNDGGKFSDQTAALAPGLQQSGMVTSAIWSDVDDDSWTDLLVTYEWGPVRVWKNVQGSLEDHSSAAGTAGLLGWWNSITAGDFDGDGDMDYALGNVGLNTKYEVPALLYYGDFGVPGRKQLVEAEVEGEVLYPVRGKSCTSHAIPGIGSKFESYRDFAAAPLGEIYPEERLDSALRLEANTLASGILRNRGSGELEFEPFADPLAQIAPVFGIVAADFNADGDLDLFLAQNFYSPQPETGRMDGGLSVVLLGDGGGGFGALRADESGIAIAGDASCAAPVGRGLVVGINDGAWQMYRSRPGEAPVSIRLQGKPGNPSAIGARLRLLAGDDLIGSAEISAGGGYLSQAPATLSLSQSSGLTAIEVRWLDGSESTWSGPPGGPA